MILPAKEIAAISKERAREISTLSHLMDKIAEEIYDAAHDLGVNSCTIDVSYFSDAVCRKAFKKLEKLGYCAYHFTPETPGPDLLKIEW
jgi:hypothetical protein